MRSAKKSLSVFAILILLSMLTALIAPVFAGPGEQVIRIQAKRYEYTPSEITLKKGKPVVLELTSMDRMHGFNCPAFGIRGDINLNKVTTIRFTPDKVGTFEFHCDIFCGSGHETMTGRFVVTE